MSRPLTWIYLGVVVVAILTAPSPASAQPLSAAAVVQALAAPAQIDLVPGDVGRILVALTNGTSHAVAVTRVEALGPPQLQIGPVAPIGSLAPGDSVSRTLTLRAEEGVEAGSVGVVFFVSYPNGTEGVVTTSVMVSIGASPQALSARFISSPVKLSDGARDVASVLLSNNTPFSFSSVQIDAVDSHDIDLTSATLLPAHPSCPAISSVPIVACFKTMPPGTSQVVDLKVSVGNRVIIGAQTVGIVVRADADTPSALIPSTQEATFTTTLTVFGVDALGPFGISSLFVLPGLVALSLALLLIRYAYPRSPTAPDAVDFKDPRSLVFIVPAAAAAYLIVWGIQGVNLTDQMGTWDVAELFLLGAALGFATWVVLTITHWWRSGRMQFSASDSHNKVLKKLEARRAQLSLPEVTVGERSYRFLSEAPDAKTVATSRFLYHFTDNSELPARLAFRDAIERNDIGAVRTAMRKGLVTVRWALPTHVATFDNSAVNLGNVQPLFVEE